jgi:hypothetical protein
VPETHSRKTAAESADDQRRAIQAVQVALDRRDNGGDAAAPGDGMPATSRSLTGNSAQVSPAGTRRL